MTPMATEKKPFQADSQPHAGVCGDTCAPTHDAIARRAHDIYVKTGWKQGQCKQNWQQAEQSLHNQARIATPSPQQGAGVAHAPGAR